MGSLSRPGMDLILRKLEKDYPIEMIGMFWHNYAGRFMRGEVIDHSVEYESLRSRTQNIETFISVYFEDAHLTNSGERSVLQVCV